MDWITGISKAIDYIEEHITEPTDYARAAKIICRRREFTKPAYTYAVFTVRGKMPDTFRETYRKICTEFFPQSGYEYGNGVEIEAYPSADVQNPDYTCEIWIAVKPKK